MSSKIFKSSYMSDNSRLEIEASIASTSFHITHCTVVSEKSFMFDNTTAPALALAILEAAGVEPSSPHYGLNDSPEWNVRWASHYLGRSIELTEAKTAEAKEQAELEAEALELYNARILFLGGEALTSFEKLNQDNKDMWLAVARKAREIAKESANGH